MKVTVLTLMERGWIIIQNSHSIVPLKTEENPPLLSDYLYFLHYCDRHTLTYVYKTLRKSTSDPYGFVLLFILMFICFNKIFPPRLYGLLNVRRQEPTFDI